MLFFRNDGTASARLFLVYATLFVNALGFGLVFPLLPFYAKEFNATDMQVGVLAASFAVGQFIASPVWGRVSDRVGRKPIIARSLAGNIIAFTLFGFANALPWLIVLRFAQGLLAGGIVPTVQAYVADLTPKEHRTKGMANVSAALALGLVFGPAAGGLLADISLSIPFFAAAAAAAANLLFVLVFLPESISQKSERLAVKEGLPSVSRMIGALRGDLAPFFITILLWSLSVSTIQVAVPLLGAERFGISASSIGVFFAVMGSAAALTQLFVITRITKKIGEHATLLVGLGSIAVALLMFVFAVMPLALGAAMTVMAFGSSLTRPTAASIISQATHEGQGAMLGVLGSFASLGRIVGPIAGGTLFGLLGPSAPFLATAVLVTPVLAVLAIKKIASRA